MQTKERSKDQIEHLANIRKRSFEAQPRLAELEKILLGIGGDAVVWFHWEDDLEKLLTRGYDASGLHIEQWEGQPNQCHANSASFWDEFESKRPDLRIMSGYGLSEDGLWRQHTWCIDKDETDGEIIWESTVLREKYFGVMLSPAECEEFLNDNP